MPCYSSASVCDWCVLGEWAVHHDESLHGYYGYQLSIGNDYKHSPLTHGMFLFQLIGATFLLFGDSEFTLRLSMVLIGSALILTPWFLRKHLGDIGAIVTAVLLTFSPALFYFSRFARNDILMALFAALMVIGIWRYIDERRPRWLYLTVGVFAVSMATKESAYILVVIFGAYLAWVSRYEIRDVILGNMRLSEVGPYGQLLVVLAAISAPFFAAGFSVFQHLFGVTLAAVEGTPGIATGAPEGGTGTWIAAISTLTIFAIGVAIGAYWNWCRFWVCLAIFWAIYAVIMTNFGNHYPGIITGVWQSLGYWIAQHDVRRGSQPWYYYFVLGSVYEFLPMLASLVIALYYAIKSGWRSIGLIIISVTSFAIATTLMYTLYYKAADPPHAILILPFIVLGFVTLLAVPLTLQTSKFHQFLVFYAFALFSALSIAGEKMPWLLAQLTVPFIFLAGKGIGNLILTIDWRAVIYRYGWVIVVLTPLFLIAFWRLIFFDLYTDFNITQTRDLVQFFELWSLIAFCALVVVWLVQRSLARGFRQTFGVVAITVAVLMFAFTIRAGMLAVYEHGDTPKDMLIYTQTTPDLHQTVEEIRQARDLAWNKGEFSLAIDTRDGFSWPLLWYFRDQEGVGYISLEDEGTTVSDERTVVLVNAKNNENVKDSLKNRFDEGRHVIFRWWFPELYKDKSPADVFRGLTDRNLLRPIADFWFHRELPTDLGYVDAYVYFRDDTPKAPLR